jgi:hypothetical protein
VFGRFEAERPNELWTGDALHGPRVGGRTAYLFAFSTPTPARLSGTAGGSPRTPSGWPPRCVRRSPRAGSRRGCISVLTGEPAARKRARPVRGQAERKRTINPLAPRRSAEPTRTVRDQFLVEITGESTEKIAGHQGRHLVADLEKLNRLFTAWVEQVYHQVRPARRLLIFASVVTLTLNVADPLLAGQYGKAAFDAVGPMLLITVSVANHPRVRKGAHVRAAEIQAQRRTTPAFAGRTPPSGSGCRSPRNPPRPRAHLRASAAHESATPWADRWSPILTQLGP